MNLSISGELGNSLLEDRSGGFVDPQVYIVKVVGSGLENKMMYLLQE